MADERPPDSLVLQPVLPAEAPRRLPRAALAAVALGGAAVAAIWWFTPLRHLGPADLARWIAPYRESSLAVPVTLAIYLLSGLLLVPMSLVMVATGLSFGPALGAVLALSGCLLSASANYAIGAALGRDLVHKLRSPRLHKLNHLLSAHGFWAIATVRVVPVAPFGLVNLVAGSSDIRFRDYFLGTVATLTPTVVLSSLFGDRIGALVRNPNVVTALSVVGVVILLVATGLVMRARIRKRSQAAIVPPREPY
jgi:phospholipase D1/2